MKYFKEEDRKTIPLRVASIFLSNKQFIVAWHNVFFKMVLMIRCTTLQHIFGDVCLFFPSV